MNRWLFLFAACTCCLWGCTDETSPGTTSTSTSTTTSSAESSTSTTSSTSGSGGAGGGSTSSTSGSGGAGGSEPTDLVACVDMYDGLMMPPNGTLPCEYIPPGLALPQ